MNGNDKVYLKRAIFFQKYRNCL